MGSNVFTAAFVKYETGYYGYSHPAITGHNGFVNGQPLVDCSALVYAGLYDAGYRLPNINSVSDFSTYTLFNTDTFTSFALTNFDPFSIADVQKQNGALQIGDIICFRAKEPNKDKNGNPIKDPKGNLIYDQHVGIFSGYDENGNPMFYASGTTNGPSVSTIGPKGTYWNGDHEIIVGALRPHADIQTGLDTTLSVTETIGYGKSIPGQTPDPTAQYRKIYGLNGNVMLLYKSGEIYTYNQEEEIWRIPDSNGKATTITREIYGFGTPQIHYGNWVIDNFNADGTPAPLAPAGTHALAFVGGVNPGNPLLDPASAQAYALADATGSVFSLTNQTTNNAIGYVDAITLYASATSLTDQTIQLTLQGDSTNKYVCTGADRIAFVNGKATITIPAGQDNVTVTLIDASATNTSDILNLTATLIDPNAPAGSTPIASNNLAVTFASPNPFASSATPVTPDHTIQGDLNPIVYGTDASGNPIYHYDALGNAITDGTAAPNFNDTLNGSGGNDLINTGGGTNIVNATQGGSDTINGGAGADNITAGNGANVISGNGGQDILIAGNGKNQIYANGQIDLAAALAKQKDPASIGTGQKGDLIAVGDGANLIVGSNGNDYISTGTGSNTIVLGNGDNVVQGGVETSAALADWSAITNTPYETTITGITLTSAAAPPVTPPYHGNYTASGPVGGGNDGGIGILREAANNEEWRIAA